MEADTMRARGGGVRCIGTLTLALFGLAGASSAADSASPYNAIPMATPVDGYVPMGRSIALPTVAARSAPAPAAGPAQADPPVAGASSTASTPILPGQYPVRSASATLQSSRRQSGPSLTASPPVDDEQGEVAAKASNRATVPASPTPPVPAAAADADVPAPTTESTLSQGPALPARRANLAVDPSLPGDPGPLSTDASICTGVRDFFSGRSFPTEGYPAYTITATSLILHRSLAKSPALVENAATGATLLDAHGLDPGTAVGPKFNVTMNFASGYQFEFIFFGLEGWHTSNTLASSSGNLEVPIFSGDRFSHLETTYSSRLFNQEINSKHQLVGPINILSGFRAIELNENLSFAGSGATTNGTANLKTRNWLLGVQIGGEALLVERGRFSLDCFAKSGIYINPTRLTTNQTGNVTFPSGSSDYAHEAFAGDVGLNANYFLGRGWSTTVGYQALWLDRVALAPNQAASTPAVNIRGEAFFQGVNLGLIKQF